MAGVSLTYSGLYTSMTTSTDLTGKTAYIGTSGVATLTSKGAYGTITRTDSTLTVTLNTNVGATSASAPITVANDGTKTGTWNVAGTTDGDYFVIKDSVDGGTISGGLGNDTFSILSADKLVIDGGAGADLFLLTSTSGSVSLYGGLGADTFDFRSAGSASKATFLQGGYNPDEDIILTSGSSLSNLSTNALTADDAAKLVNQDGVLTLNGVTVTLPGTYNGTDYYKTKITDGTTSRTVYAGSGTAATVNGSAENASILVIGNNNQEADVLRGGNGADNVYAGAGDSILGGRGNDTITLSTTTSNTGVSVGFSETAKAGDDVVQNAKLNTGNTFSEDATSYYLGNGRLGSQFKGVSFDDTTGDITLKGQDGTVKIEKAVTAGATSGSFMNAVVADAGGSYNTTFFKDTLQGVAEKNAQIYYSASTKGVLDFQGVTSDLVIDLANSGGLGDESTYYNVAMVQAGNGNNVVMVGGSGSTTLKASGGQTSLWGGSAANDSLIGGSGRDYFALSAKGGKDSVDFFTTGSETYSDVVYLLGTGLATVKKNSSNSMTFTGTDGSSLVMKNVQGGTDDDVIGYSTNGTDIFYGKVGTSGTKSTFTYDSRVTAYVGGKAGSTLNVYNSGDTTVWLDGNMGVGYQNIGVVDASTVSGNAVLGGTAANETLMGGNGQNTLWGGSGTDSLVGGSGQNTFVVGAGEGTSIIANGKTSDTVMLYNVASTGVSSSTLKNGNLTIAFRNGGSFTVNDYLNGPSTFNTTDGTYSVNADGTIDFSKNA